MPTIVSDRTQQATDRANAEFWNELCGTGLARHLGIREHSKSSLERFDRAYYRIYPYLLPIVAPKRMAGHDVLEIGLGYGTLSQTLAAACANYTGLDIAAGPVNIVNHRLRMGGYSGCATQGSALEMPFSDASFDFVVSIGCFHHTGNLRRCINESWRVLRPGGRLVAMVYNRFSMRQWLHWPLETYRYARAERSELPPANAHGTNPQRAAYDAHVQTGEACPETEFHSIRQLRHMLRQFEQITFRKRNCDQYLFGGVLPFVRPFLLRTIGPVLGLDIYFEAAKPASRLIAIT